MNELFPDEDMSSLSPKAEWVKRYGISLKQNNEFVCASFYDPVKDQDIFSDYYLNEDDALEDLAIKLRIPFFLGKRIE
tara:strand:- start:330 stop:563 length:234 start_codon:yes stop_codon:yes gene_type:complete